VSEYARRFGLCDAAQKWFSRRESGQPLVVSKPKPAFSQPKKATNFDRIAAILQRNPQGIVSVDIAAEMKTTTHAVSKCLHIMSERGDVIGRRFKNSKNSAKMWFWAKGREFYPTVNDIQSAVAFEFGVCVDDLLEDHREKSIAVPRHIAVYLCRELKPFSYPTLAKKFGNRDHSTIMSSDKRAREILKADLDLAERVNRLRLWLDRGSLA
jgi:hypothetical protein